MMTGLVHIRLAIADVLYLLTGDGALLESLRVSVVEQFGFKVVLVVGCGCGTSTSPVRQRLESTQHRPWKLIGTLPERLGLVLVCSNCNQRS